MKFDKDNFEKRNSQILEKVSESAVSKAISRREFIYGAGATIAVLNIVPSHVLGGPRRVSPSETIQIGGIGIGGVGHGQLRSISQQANTKIVALCDVDDVYAAKTYNYFPNAKRYRDFHQMLDAEADKIDAVYCGTPDHTHTVVSSAALKKGKHVCCVKPLTRTIDEVRTLTRIARESKVATQVTASANTSDGACRLCEMIWDGAIGDVHEAHCWSNRPLWPQGMLRPPGEDKVPETFDWDLWIGPASMRPFKDEWPPEHLALSQISARQGKSQALAAVYHPWNFRGWWDFGTGALGDMGCHHFNTVFKVLKLRYPTNISANSTIVFDETAPLASIVTYDGGMKPPRPSELETGRDLPANGNMYVGDKGKILDNRIIPESKMQDYKLPPKTLQRRSGTWGEWVEAIRGSEPASCNFDWASIITESVLLGNIAIRAGKKLNWDAESMKFTNNSEADKYIKEPYRSGWSF